MIHIGLMVLNWVCGSWIMRDMGNMILCLSVCAVCMDPNGKGVIRMCVPSFLVVCFVTFLLLSSH